MLLDRYPPDSAKSQELLKLLPKEQTPTELFKHVSLSSADVLIRKTLTNYVDKTYKPSRLDLQESPKETSRDLFLHIYCVLTV